MRKIDDNDFTLRILIPENLANDKSIASCITAIDPELRAVGKNVDLPALFYRLDELTSNQLDHIAEGWDTYNWDVSWDVVKKRQFIKTALFEKCKRGTLYAVKKALESVLSGVSIREWWQENPTAPVHTFTIELDFGELEQVLSANDMLQLLRFVDYAKPVRSHYRFIVKTAGEGNIYYSPAFMRNAVYNRIRDCTQDLTFFTSNIATLGGMRGAIGARAR